MDTRKTTTVSTHSAELPLRFGRLEIWAQGMETPEWLRERIERRLAFALGRFAPEISRVRVTLEDLNATRGGVDKRCRIQIAGRRIGRLLVEETDAEVVAAVDRAAGRMSRAAARALDRASWRRPARRLAGGPATRSPHWMEPVPRVME